MKVTTVPDVDLNPFTREEMRGKENKTNAWKERKKEDNEGDDTRG